ncbi:128aa long hypothetical protein [Pyrococcus horikoshii OT3]|uniref:Uncharacterized protein n=1 Tax=Pyrococcus horikoshii (strain ATCC 700860 / DSM 12428 / JCM 9974 / NBRC 100139 / OT-3) TaxID=70601 RepID=O58910_PYRHO|nr:128aa long hypothetical protein [Pyrococcus horikoshii OT3]
MAFATCLARFMYAALHASLDAFISFQSSTLRTSFSSGRAISSPMWLTSKALAWIRIISLPNQTWLSWTLISFCGGFFPRSLPSEYQMLSSQSGGRTWYRITYSSRSLRMAIGYPFILGSLPSNHTMTF